MIETFNATLSPMLVMFLCIIIGFIAKKFSLAPPDTAIALSRLENCFFVPALIINTFMKYCTASSIKSEYKLIIYCGVVLAAALCISLPLSKLFVREGYERSIYKYALTFGNFSFMGNAIVPAILGEEMLYRYMLYILPINIAVYTWGLLILIPHEKNGGSVLKNLFNPIFVSIIIGAALGLLNLTPYIPSFVATTISNCAACMGPLAMILTGFVIGGYDIPGLLSDKKVYVASGLRLIVLPALFIGLLYLLGADKTAIILTLFAFGTPLGLNTVVFPAAYGGDTRPGASMAMISHTLCVVTIPLIYAAAAYLLK